MAERVHNLEQRIVETSNEARRSEGRSSRPRKRPRRSATSSQSPPVVSPAPIHEANATFTLEAGENQLRTVSGGLTTEVIPEGDLAALGLQTVNMDDLAALGVEASEINLDPAASNAVNSDEDMVTHVGGNDEDPAYDGTDVDNPPVIDLTGEEDGDSLLSDEEFGTTNNNNGLNNTVSNTLVTAQIPSPAEAPALAAGNEEAEEEEEIISLSDSGPEPEMGNNNSVINLDGNSAEEAPLNHQPNYLSNPPENSNSMNGLSESNPPSNPPNSHSSTNLGSGQTVAGGSSSSSSHNNHDGQNNPSNNGDNNSNDPRDPGPPGGQPSDPPPPPSAALECPVC